MRRREDKFKELNRTRHPGRIIIVTAAVLALCISGCLCARKLQLDQTYLTMKFPAEETIGRV